MLIKSKFSCFLKLIPLDLVIGFLHYAVTFPISFGAMDKTLVLTIQFSRILFLYHTSLQRLVWTWYLDLASFIDLSVSKLSYKITPTSLTHRRHFDIARSIVPRCSSGVVAPDQSTVLFFAVIRFPWIPVCVRSAFPRVHPVPLPLTSSITVPYPQVVIQHACHETVFRLRLDLGEICTLYSAVVLSLGVGHFLPDKQVARALVGTPMSPSALWNTCRQ